MQALALVVLLLLKATPLNAEPDAPIGAGIIAATCKEDESLYLLARERDSERAGWGHLGGTRNGVEPLISTALREFTEESNCLFILDDPRLLQLSGPSLSGGFASYHMMVEYRPTAAIAESQTCRTDERDQWIWVRRNDLLSALRTIVQSPHVLVAEGDRKSVPLWSKAATALRQALIDKIIPEQDPCQP